MNRCFSCNCSIESGHFCEACIGKNLQTMDDKPCALCKYAVDHHNPDAARRHLKTVSLAYNQRRLKATAAGVIGFSVGLMVFALVSFFVGGA